MKLDRYHWRIHSLRPKVCGHMWSLCFSSCRASPAETHAHDEMKNHDKVGCGTNVTKKLQSLNFWTCDMWIAKKSGDVVVPSIVFSFATGFLLAFRLMSTQSTHAFLFMGKFGQPNSFARQLQALKIKAELQNRKHNQLPSALRCSLQQQHTATPVPG